MKNHTKRIKEAMRESGIPVTKENLDRAYKETIANRKANKEFRRSKYGN